MAGVGGALRRLGRTRFGVGSFRFGALRGLQQGDYTRSGNGEEREEREKREERGELGCKKSKRGRGRALLCLLLLRRLSSLSLSLDLKRRLLHSPSSFAFFTRRCLLFRESRCCSFPFPQRYRRQEHPAAVSKRAASSKQPRTGRSLFFDRWSIALFLRARWPPLSSNFSLSFSLSCLLGPRREVLEREEGLLRVDSGLDLVGDPHGCEMRKREVLFLFLFSFFENRRRK